MKIAPKPTPGQEVTLNDLLGVPQESLTQTTPAPQVQSPSATPAKSVNNTPPTFKLSFMDEVGDCAILENLPVWDGNGGLSFPTLEVYLNPIQVKSYPNFLHLDDKALNSQTNGWGGRFARWISDKIGWTLPAGFYPASAPVLYGMIRSLVHLWDSNGIDWLIGSTFPKEVFRQGIYTGTWITTSNSQYDIARHNDQGATKNPAIHFPYAVLPHNATSNPTCISPGDNPSSKKRFGEYCNAIIGSPNWTEFDSLCRRVGGPIPHFRLLTQFYKKQVSETTPIDSLPVIISTNPHDLDPSIPQKHPDRAYVYAVRVVVP